MRGRGQVPFRTADINWGWVERRQEEKLSWQPVFHRKLQGILFSWVVTIHWNCPSPRDSLGRRASRCCCHTLRDTPGCTQLPSASEMLPMTASAGASILEFWLQQSRWRTCRVDPVHILLLHEMLGGWQEAMTGVLHCTWKGLGCLVHGKWEERDEMCNRNFAVNTSFYLY